MGGGAPVTLKTMASRGVRIPTAMLKAQASYYNHKAQVNPSPANISQVSWVYQQVTQRQAEVTAHYQAASSGQGKQHLRETQSMLNNWSKALEETIRHVCGPQAVKAQDNSKSKSTGDWGKISGVTLSKTSDLFGTLDSVGEIGGTIGGGIADFTSKYFKPVLNLKISDAQKRQINGVSKFASKIGPTLTALSKFMDNPVVKIATAGLAIAADMSQGKTLGQAVAHVGGGILAGIVGGAVAVGAATLVGVTAPTWVVAGAAIGVVYLYEKMYDDKKSLVRTTVDGIGGLVGDFNNAGNPLSRLKPEEFIPLPPNY